MSRGSTHYGELPVSVVSMGGAYSDPDGTAPIDGVVRNACPPHITLRRGVNWAPGMGGERFVSTADAGRVMSAIRTLARQKPLHKSLLVCGKSSGGAKAWNTFRLHYNEIRGLFKRAALVLIDAHGTVRRDGHLAYSCTVDLWWPPNWPQNLRILRVYNIFQQLHPRNLPRRGERWANTITGAAFDEASRDRLAMHVDLTQERNAPHHMEIVHHQRTSEVLRAAFRFTVWGT